MSKPRINLTCTEEQKRLWTQAAQSGERPLDLPDWMRLKLDAAAADDIQRLASRSNGRKGKNEH